MERLRIIKTTTVVFIWTFNFITLKIQYLEPIPKMDRNIAPCFAILSVKYLTKSKRKYVRTIIRIPDDLWNEITNILPDEKPENIIGRPIVPYRKVFDGI